MIVELELNEEAIRENGKKRGINTEDTERFIRSCHWLKATDNLKVYHGNTSCFIHLYKGYESFPRQPYMIDYGYCATCEAMEKYILSRYGDNDKKPFYVEVDLIDKDYEKIYKEGTYIRLDGTPTHQDWYNVEGIEEEMKHLEFEDKFLGFAVLSLDPEYKPY